MRWKHGAARTAARSTHGVPATCVSCARNADLRASTAFFWTRWCSGTIFRRTSGRCWERKASSPSATPCAGQGWSRKACLHDASWDAYNSARLMETAHSPNFAADVEKAQAACYQEAPKMQGGLPLDVMKKLAALLQSSQPEPAMAV